MLVLACGAIAREVLAVIDLNGWTHVDVRCLPAKLHSTPDADPRRGRREARRARGTATSASSSRMRTAARAVALDPVLERHGVERLPGAHCYGFLAGNDAWDAMHEDEPATFYLTDFLARHFDALVVRGAQARRASGAAADDVRQLPAARLPRADRRSRTRRARRGGGRRSSASPTSGGGRATASSSRRSRGSSRSRGRG